MNSDCTLTGNANMEIEPLGKSTYPAWVTMRRDFWGDDEATVREAYEIYIEQNRAGRAITFFAVEEDGRHVGFVDAELRTDHVDGARASPVWYLEGVYVVPDRRGSGAGTFMVNHLETHVRDQGYSEIASDCEIGNHQSEAFHKAIGFSEAIRSIHFIKRLT